MNPDNIMAAAVAMRLRRFSDNDIGWAMAIARWSTGEGFRPKVPPEVIARLFDPINGFEGYNAETGKTDRVLAEAMIRAAVVL